MTKLWTPDTRKIIESNIQTFIQTANQSCSQAMDGYRELYQWSIEHREDFWQLIADFYSVKFYQPPSAVLANDCMPGAEWFPDSTLNYAEHMLRRRDDHCAILFRGENGARQSITYRELYDSVARAQGGLIKAGITKGDRVAAVMPNCVETVVMMLAATGLGAIWSSCSPDFGIQGILDRFGQIEPKILLTTDGYFYNGKTIDILEKISGIQQQVRSLEKTVVVPFTSSQPNIGTLSQSLLFDDFCDAQCSEAVFKAVGFNHPLFIMYSSGTTGVPKCIVHGHGGTLLQHLKELGLHTDLKESDTIFYFTTCGWMMWNWSVSSLGLGATLVLYDGSPFYPGPESLIDMAEEEQISIFGTSAKYIAALEKAGVKPKKTHDLSALRILLSTGSPLAHESFDYVYHDIKGDIQLSSISGGTDIVSCFALGCPILPVYRGELQCRGLAMDVAFVDPGGLPVYQNKGELTCRSSFPSMPVMFWDDSDGKKFQNAYFNQFNNVWAHGDYGELTEHDGVIIHGRADAVLNPGGVRIGTAEIYRQVEKVEAVLESIAVSQEWDDDVRIVLFVKLRDDSELDSQLEDKIRRTIRKNTTPRHVPAKILSVKDIPRTISGKIAELAVRNIIHNLPVKNIEALANPEALVFFKNRLELKS